MKLKKELRKIVKYMLDSDASSDLIENYVETFILINTKYIKQLTLKDVSKSFASGVKVQIVDCLKGHEFSIGEIVEIIEYFENDLWLAKGFGNHKWYINEEEANVC